MISLCNTFIQCTHFILKCSWCKMKCVDVPSVLSASIKRVYFMGFLKPLAYNAISCLSTYHEKYAYAKVSKELEHTCCWHVASAKSVCAAATAVSLQSQRPIKIHTHAQFKLANLSKVTCSCFENKSSETMLQLFLLQLHLLDEVKKAGIKQLLCPAYDKWFWCNDHEYIAATSINAISTSGKPSTWT